jgi:hypothetical protein
MQHVPLASKPFNTNATKKRRQIEKKKKKKKPISTVIWFDSFVNWEKEN